MKFYIVFFIGVCIFIPSCSHNPYLDTRDRIIEVRDRDGYKLGHGVIFDRESILLPAHVYKRCQYLACTLRNSTESHFTILEVIMDDPSKDRVILKIAPLPYRIIENQVSISPTDTPIYALVSRSGSWQKISGKILALDREYIALDSSLTPSYHSGAIETDIVLEPGESGTPIWTLSGELIGVMSASEREGKRGWVVR